MSSIQKNLQDLTRVTYVGLFLNGKDQQSLADLFKIGYETSKSISFYDKVICTFLKPECETYDFSVVHVDEVDYGSYTEWVFKNLKNTFSSEFMINYHSDGMIQNPEAWTDEFLNYDYIGAPWLLGSQIEFPDGTKKRWGGGNGGFALRSKRLCKALSDIDISPNNPIKGIADNEDFLICKTHFDLLTEKGIKFAPTDISAKFSTEHFSPSPQGFTKSFGFHEIEKLFDPDVKNYRKSQLKEILSR